MFLLLRRSLKVLVQGCRVLVSVAAVQQVLDQQEEHVTGSGEAVAVAEQAFAAAA